MSSNPGWWPGTVTISAGINGYEFWNGTRATMKLDWESPWDYTIRRYNGTDLPTDPQFTVTSHMPNDATFYSGTRAITAQYVIQQNAPFEQKTPCLVQTQASSTVTNAYYSARFAKIYNQVFAYTPNGSGISIEAFIGPSGLATVNQIYQYATRLGTEWDDGIYSIPAIFLPQNSWSLYYEDPAAGWYASDLSFAYNQYGRIGLAVGYPTSRMGRTYSAESAVQNKTGQIQMIDSVPMKSIYPHNILGE